MVNPQNLVKGQSLKINFDKLNDRLSKELLNKIRKDPSGKLVGFKMVDGNAFGLVLELADGNMVWFFQEELSEDAVSD